MNVSSSTSFSPWSSARDGINTSFNLANQSANTIAQRSVTKNNDNDLNGALIQQKQATSTVLANVKGLQVAQSNMSTLLDIMA